MKSLKRNAVIVVVLLFVCAAVYLNWSYNNQWGAADKAMVNAEDAAMLQADKEYEAAILKGREDVETDAGGGDEQGSAIMSDYFASARLTRQQSRDEALGLLQQAASAETASQEIIDSAMNGIAVMAGYSMREMQVENLLIAKDFDECVVSLSADTCTIAVPAPIEGLSAAAVARITDIVMTETGLSATQIKVIEVKNDLE